MASSLPNNNANPPYPPHIIIPPQAKRRSTDMMPTSAPAAKRRKQSMLSTTSSSHPLRQTSFPPDEADQGAQYSPSPSLDNMSLVSSNTKKGTKSKKSTGKRKANDDDTASLVSGRGLLSIRNGRAGSARGSKDQSRGASAGAGIEEEDDDEDDGHGMALAANVGITANQINARVTMIREAMDPQQQLRYDAWKSAKLNPPTVKKLINQTLSQSVPEAVVFAIRIAAKLFAGEMVERARKVRDQWIRTSLETQLGIPKSSLLLQLPSPPSLFSPSSTQPSAFASSQLIPSSSNSTFSNSQPSFTLSQLPSSAQQQDNLEARVKSLEMDVDLRGPLLPEHLQEAFRRYKEYDGPDRKMLNIWRATRATGAERFGVRNRKGRLFGGGRAIG